LSPVPEPLPLPGDAPDIIAPVHAFRDWRVSPDGLASPRTGVPWTERIMSAECRPRTPEALLAPKHEPPGRACSCGIHAYFQPNRETSRVDYTGVTGIVTVWGRLAVHANGVRAEFARVEALGVYGRWTRRQKAVVAEVAASLDVDVMDLAELEYAAHRYATPLPSDLIPSPPAHGRSSWHKRPLAATPRLLLVER
jgi:hypothetical protein